MKIIVKYINKILKRNAGISYNIEDKEEWHKILTEKRKQEMDILKNKSKESIVLQNYITGS